MKIAIVTDAWHPQINGVVTTLSHTQRVLASWGHDVHVLSPVGHRTFPCPTYPEIRLAVLPERKLHGLLEGLDADAIHIATEGPLGVSARRFCVRRGLDFTTSYHTRFPQYVSKRLPIPEGWSYAYLRGHHNAARCTMVATEGQRRELLGQGFRNVAIWSRGVDIERFRPLGRNHLPLPRPIWMYAGRIAVEKNLEAYLSLDLPGTKVVVGDGPDLKALARQFPDAHFAGYRFGEELPMLLSSADVFVFPSRTDTFGLVVLEAMACGTPIAAFPVSGPLDVVDDGVTGILDGDLRRAALAALHLDRDACRAAAERRTWSVATGQFLENLAPVRDPGEALPAAV